MTTGGNTPGIDADAVMASMAAPSESTTSLPGDYVVGDDMQRRRGVGEIVVVDVATDETAERLVRDQVVALSAEAADERAHA